METLICSFRVNRYTFFPFLQRETTFEAFSLHPRARKPIKKGSTQERVCSWWHNFSKFFSLTHNSIWKNEAGIKNNRVASCEGVPIYSNHFLREILWLQLIFLVYIKQSKALSTTYNLLFSLLLGRFHIICKNRLSLHYWIFCLHHNAKTVID